LQSLRDTEESASDTIVPEDLEKLELQRRQYWRFELTQFWFLEYFLSSGRMHNMLAF